MGWVGGKSSKRRGNTDSSVDKENATTSPGCMCSVFHLFDFHNFQIPSQPKHLPSLNLDTLLLDDPPLIISKGYEAPRNSLELDQELELPSSSTIQEEHQSLLNIPMAIQIKTNDTSSEISSSPSTKTPTLVARLMGLDLLPDQTYSPVSNSSTLIDTQNPQRKSHYSKRRSKLPGDNSSGTRSLPETPRISSARRSDVEHRLSLQINKENTSPAEELSLSNLKRRELKTYEDENRSPGHYARQIVKQVKESVSRKVGLDITNTVRSSRDHHELVNQLKTKKILSKVGHDDSSKNAMVASASCSPRLKFLEPRNIKPVQSKKDLINISQSLTKTNSSEVNVISPKITKPPTKLKIQEQAVQQHQLQIHVKKCKKVAEERFRPPPRLIRKPPQTSDIIRNNKQEEAFVRQATVTKANIPDKKFKKTTPLSNEILNITVPTLLLPVKKDPTPRATKIPQKPAPNSSQESKRISQLSSCSSHDSSYKQQKQTPPTTSSTLNARVSSINDTSNGAVSAATGAAKEEHEYISRILKRTGVDKDSPVSFTGWFSPSHPLDPSIFYYLEYFTPAFTNYIQLSHRCNRKLLFHLANEILVEFLKPYMNLKPWLGVRFCLSTVHGSDLVDILCSKVRSFPCTDCRVLEDIDALIDKDMMTPQSNFQNETAFSEEAEGIVTELEKDLLDSLIHETAVIFHGGV
ncbi:uncharacterized protein LOC126670969 [Mercurialis annua]|uniref:uncharacterized protein LOC126670969 n=1 Tax=Mercurialis annua TaxID=3986 RepID=UPI002160D17F|nr:uncharacterized protein LOC126670969 [Mercurialis annua]